MTKTTEQGGDAPSGYWTTKQAAAWAKVSPGRMRVILADVTPKDAQTGTGRQHVYKISEVKAAVKKMPGQGTRTDLK